AESGRVETVGLHDAQQTEVCERPRSEQLLGPGTRARYAHNRQTAGNRLHDGVVSRHAHDYVGSIEPLVEVRDERVERHARFAGPPPQVLPNIRFALRPGDHDAFPAGARYRRRECLEQVAAVLTATGRRDDKWAPSPVGAGRPWIVGLRYGPSGA